MGILGTLRHLCFGDNRSSAQAERISRNFKTTARGPRRCQIEELEARRLFATDVAPHVLLGSTYFESDSGDDSKPDTLQVTFVGGAPGTTLNHLTINGDKRQDGLSDGDIFFDTAAGGLGSFKYNDLSISSADGFTVNDAIVHDGGSLITFDFTGFKAGDKLVFTIDADEAQFVDGTTVDTNSTVEGGEFQRSILVGQFSAPGFVDLSLQALYWDYFDTNFSNEQTATGETLDLPNDAYTPDHDYSDRTAGAIVDAAQIPLATISGWVYHDRSNDGVFNTGTEEGIGGVTVELLDANGNGTGITTTTSTDPGKVGFYEFLNLTPGKYGVREVQPNGWLDGKDTAGDHGGTAADESAGRVDRITGATLDYGDHGLNYNFGELLPGSISGQVVVCDNDTVIPGVQIDLWDGAGKVVATTVTNDNGDYSFTGLVPGQYSVHEHQPAGYYDHAAYIGSGDGFVDDPNDMSHIDIGSDQHLISYDFCEHLGVNLSGNVYHDRNDDGIFDTPTEEGIAGVTLKLIDGNGNDTGLRATTDAKGHYEFTDLAAGAYEVVEVQPEGWLDGKDTPGNSGGIADPSPPGDRISQIVLNWNVNGVEYNFGELLPGSIAGQVIVCQTDTVIPGVTIDLTDSTGKIVATTVTEDNGDYSFTGLRPGVYGVHEHQPAGYFDHAAYLGSGDGVVDDPNDMTRIDIGSDQHLINYDFCELPPGSIAGTVVVCDTDTVIPNVQVDLLDGDGKLVASTTTDQNGNYRFTGLQPGVYSVHEHQPADYFQHTAFIGSGDGVVEDPDDITHIDIGSGENLVNYDFCEHVGVMLSGYVYYDHNNDGIYDRTSETPIAGVVVKLLDANGNDTGLRATTDATGFYKFNNLAAGTYSVMEIQPSGWLDGKDTPGNVGGVALPPPGDMISQITIDWTVNGTEYDFGELLPRHDRRSSGGLR